MSALSAFSHILRIRTKQKKKAWLSYSSHLLKSYYIYIIMIIILLVTIILLYVYYYYCGNIAVNVGFGGSFLAGMR